MTLREKKINKLVEFLELIRKNGVNHKDIPEWVQKWTAENILDALEIIEKQEELEIVGS